MLEVLERCADHLARRPIEVGLEGNEVRPFDTPAVIIHSRNERLVPLQEAEVIVGLGRNARLELIDTASHMLPLTHPDRVAAHLFPS